MRTLNIPMTQAAKKRLSLLQHLHRLAIPLDPETHKPFAFVFRNEVMFVTFEGKDVACVPDVMNEDRKSFDLMVNLASNPTADAALMRFFSTLTQHLNRVHTVMAAEERELRQLENQRMAQNRAEREVEAVSAYEATQPFLTTKTSQPLPSITRAEFEEIMRFRSDDDILYLTPNRDNAINVGLRGKACGTLNFSLSDNRITEMEVRFSAYDVDELFVKNAMTRNNEVFDLGVIERHLREMLDRSRRIADPAAALACIRDVPETDYSLQTGILKKFDARVSCSAIADLGEGFSAQTTSRTLSILREGCTVLYFDVTQIRDNHTIAQALFKPVHLNHNMFLGRDIANDLTATDLEKVFGIWISTIAGANPDVDFSSYKKADPEEIARAFADLDTGYGF